MGNGSYDHQSIHHHHFHQKTIFLPMFCRLSIKDITLINSHRKNQISGDNEPSSPKVSCMGQVKRNNRVISFPSDDAAGTVSTHHHRYSKLKKLFSTKKFLPPTICSDSGAAAACGGRSRSHSFRSSRSDVFAENLRRLKLRNSECEQDSVLKVMNIGEIDPPLPVVKKVAPPGVGRDEVNLWRRRFNGAAPALKGLQIEQIRNLTE